MEGTGSTPVSNTAFRTEFARLIGADFIVESNAGRQLLLTCIMMHGSYYEPSEGKPLKPSYVWVYYSVCCVRK